MKAIVQGELHTSKSDKDNLLSTITDDVDAVFQEGREDHVGKEGWSLGYFLFVSGTLCVFWLISVFARGPTLEEQVDVPFHADIDWPLPDIYEKVPNFVKFISGIIGGTVTAVGLYVPIFAIPPFESLAIYTTVAMKPILVMGGVLIFSGGLILYEVRLMGGRDERMAKSIEMTCQDQGYETVAVLCGEAHRSGIAEELRRRGWEVETHASSSRFSSLIWN
ncbi:MAG: hypothetical protein ABEI86_10085 [Halobacteriaceae archaeon]